MSSWLQGKHQLIVQISKLHVIQEESYHQSRRRDTSDLVVIVWNLDEDTRTVQLRSASNPLPPILMRHMSGREEHSVFSCSF